MQVVSKRMHTSKESISYTTDRGSASQIQRHFRRFDPRTQINRGALGITKRLGCTDTCRYTIDLSRRVLKYKNTVVSIKNADSENSKSNLSAYVIKNQESWAIHRKRLRRIKQVHEAQHKRPSVVSITQIQERRFDYRKSLEALKLRK